MDSNNKITTKITNKWVLVYREKPYLLIDKLYADTQGVNISTCNTIEQFDAEAELNNREVQLRLNIPLYAPEQYGSRVAELIAGRYSLADEGAFLSNYARVTSGIETDTIKAQQYVDEFFAFQEFREQCKIQSRKDCGVTSN